MKRLNWIAAVAIIVLLLLGGYVVTYFACSEFGPSPFGGNHREFHNEATAKPFLPMIRIESWIRDETIQVEYEEVSYPDTGGDNSENPFRRSTQD